MAKSTKAEALNRVNNIYDKLITGWISSEIVSYGIETWGVTEAAIRKYIKKANKIIVENATDYQKQALLINLAKRANLYRLAMEENDKRLALEIARDESKLLGLYAPAQSRIEQTNIEVDLNSLTDDQVKRLANGENIANIMIEK